MNDVLKQFYSTNSYSLWMHRNIGGLSLSTIVYNNLYANAVGSYCLTDDFDTLMSSTVVRFTDDSMQWFPMPDSILTRESLDFSCEKQLSDVKELYAGWNVLSIDDGVFTCSCSQSNEDDKPNLQIAYMPYVTHVGNNAFYNQYALSIAIGPSISSIGDCAFAHCSSLNEISFPDCIQIGCSCFYGCTSAKHVFLPRIVDVPEYSLASIGAEHIDIRNATNVGRYGLASNEQCNELCCQALSSCEQNAFIGTSSIRQLVLPAFAEIPNNIEFFSYLHSGLCVDEVVLPNISSIGRHGMLNSSIKRIIAPNLQSMPNGGIKFENDVIAPQLEYVTTSNLTSLGKYAFYQQSKLEYVDLANCESISGLAFATQYSGSSYHSSGIKYFYAPKLTCMADMQEGTSVNAGTFRNCRPLKAAMMPKCTFIPSTCFQNCSNLQYVNCSSIHLIGSRAFSGCSSLEIMNFGNSLSELPIMFDAQKYHDTGEIVELNYEIFLNAGSIAGILHMVVPDNLIDAFLNNSFWSGISGQTTAVVRFERYSDFMSNGCNHALISIIEDACINAGKRDFGTMADNVTFDAMQDII